MTNTPQTLRFGATPNLYALAPAATATDAADQLSFRLDHLRAMLVLVTGSGHENFAELSHELQAQYLGACSMAVDECAELARVIQEVGRKPAA
ncbi:MAG: hypothetical protein MUE35_13500 [Hydrogenophaga sp.]|nr:hypothetical protein [Hydrogenophaga sp.]